MYLRSTKRKNKDGSTVEYFQLAHNERHPQTRKPVAKIIHNFGRADQLDRQEQQVVAGQGPEQVDLPITIHVGRGDEPLSLWARPPVRSLSLHPRASSRLLASPVGAAPGPHRGRGARAVHRARARSGAEQRRRPARLQPQKDRPIDDAVAADEAAGAREPDASAEASDMVVFDQRGAAAP